MKTLLSNLAESHNARVEPESQDEVQDDKGRFEEAVRYVAIDPPVPGHDLLSLRTRRYLIICETSAYALVTHSHVLIIRRLFTQRYGRHA